MKKLITPFADIGSGPLKLLVLGQAVLFIAVLSVAHLFPAFQILPTPLEIGAAWNELATQQGLIVELFRSAGTIIKALALSTAISFGVAYLSTAALFKPISRWLTALRFLGFAGITFFLTMWTSSGVELKLWLLTFGMTFFLMTNAVALADSVTAAEVDYARTLGLSPWQITWEIFCRGKLDQSLDLVRQNAAIGWTMLSMVEGLVRSDGGIGALLLNQSKHLHLSAIIAIQLTILAYGIVQDIGLRYFRVLCCPYLSKENK